MYRIMKITATARRPARDCVCSVARAPTRPPRTAMKNSPSPRATQKARNRIVASTAGAHHIVQARRMGWRTGPLGLVDRRLLVDHRRLVDHRLLVDHRHLVDRRRLVDHRRLPEAKLITRGATGRKCL